MKQVLSVWFGMLSRELHICNCGGTSIKEEPLAALYLVNFILTRRIFSSDHPLLEEAKVNNTSCIFSNIYTKLSFGNPSACTRIIR